MKKGALICLLLIATTGFSQHKQTLKLWYNQPSGNTWENALPIGNGRLGAMVYGNVENEVIQLNEHTVWSGSPNRNDNPLALDSLAVIRQLIFDGKQKEAERIANRVIITRKSHGQMFQPVASLQLSFRGHERYSNFYRELDIERAVAKTSYTIGDVTFTREAIASFPDRVIVLRLTASKPGNLSFTASFSTPQAKATIKTTPAKELTVSGTTMDHEGVKGLVKFQALMRMKLEGGALLVSDTSLTVDKANAVTIYISIATNFNRYNDISGDEKGRAAAYLNKAESKSYAAILGQHIAAYQRYFNRVKLDLGSTEVANLPTDERLKNFAAANDPQLVHIVRPIRPLSPDFILTTRRTACQPAEHME
jgi:alpha-L-fucosidase 2